MTAQHVHSRVPGNDIDFAKGTGFMVASDSFISYLEHAVEDKAVSNFFFGLCVQYSHPFRSGGSGLHVLIIEQQNDVAKAAARISMSLG